MGNAINMVNDYIRLCRDADAIGKFEAYLRYTKRYPELFGGIFRYLYMTEPEALRGIIERTDFNRLLAIAQGNMENGFADRIQSAAMRTAVQLGYLGRFNLYLGLDLGNIGGYSGPSGNSTPFIYVGLDKPLDENCIHTLVPHEINHMVRCAALPDIRMFDVMERTISEGLACSCPIVLQKKEYSPGTYAQALGLPQENTNRLIRNTRSLFLKLSGEFDRPLTAGRMAEYFTWSAGSDRLYLGGYYVGMVIIREMMDKGYPFPVLTVMPAEKIWREYRKIIS